MYNCVKLVNGGFMNVIAIFHEGMNECLQNYVSIQNLLFAIVFNRSTTDTKCVNFTTAACIWDQNSKYVISIHDTTVT